MTSSGPFPADPLAALAAEDRPPPPDRPWIMANMVASVDGATASAGRSGRLGGPSDRPMFAAVRAIADAIVVGATTVRQERYRRPSSIDGHLELRRSLGRAHGARLVVVSGTAHLPDDLPLFDAGFDAPPHPGDERRPLLVTPAETIAAHVRATFDIASTAGDRSLVDAVASLRGDGVDTLLCEGGPSILGMLTDLDVVDEWLVTIGPSIQGGRSSRLVDGAAEQHRDLLLDRVWIAADGALFLRYLSAR